MIVCWVCVNLVQQLFERLLLLAGGERLENLVTVSVAHEDALSGLAELEVDPFEVML